MTGECDGGGGGLNWGGFGCGGVEKRGRWGGRDVMNERGWWWMVEGW